MLSRKGILVRLHPTVEQIQLLEQMVGCCRVVYNTALDQRRWFARTGRNINYASQAGELLEFKEEFDWMRTAPHHCLQQALVDLQSAYTNFWSGRAGSPKHKKRGADDSMRFPDPKQIKLSGDFSTPEKERKKKHKEAVLTLPKLGAIECVLHRQITGKICSVTVRRDGKHWVASIAVESEVALPTDRSTQAVVGIDVGIAQPVVLSTGEKYALPKATKGDLEHQAQLQRRISSKKKGSKNRRKAIQRLANFKAKQARRRRDAQEKVTTAIANKHGVVAMEALSIKNMTASAAGTIEDPGKNVAQKSGLNRSMLDVALGSFRLRLGRKLAASGGMLLLVPAHHTSQRCRICGHIEAANRATRDHFQCVKCGHRDDADYNASINIRDKAKGVWGAGDKVQISASLAMLLKQQAKPKRSFKKQKAAGFAASACGA